MAKTVCNDYSFTQNRELSWLNFNERVLMEATDSSVPLLERLKFISIFSTNLDEFFMVRVGSLLDLTYLPKEKTGKKSKSIAKEELSEIYKAVKPLYAKKDKFFEAVAKELKQEGIFHITLDVLTSPQKKEIEEYFLNFVKPILSPMVINTNHPFPHIENKRIYVATLLMKKSKKVMVLIPIPDTLPNVYHFKDTTTSYIYIEDIILQFVNKIFDDYKSMSKCKLRVTRNADIDIDDDTLDLDYDYRHKMKELLKKRRRLAPVRLELSSKLDDSFLSYVQDKLKLSQAETFITTTPMNLQNAFDLGNKLAPSDKSRLEFLPFTPKATSELDLSKSILKQVEERDILLSYPFESIDPFLKLIRESAYDENVVSIKITVYRLSSYSKLVDYLCQASENGKEVTVVIELRARFDEQNNIDWSHHLEKAGCRIFYGIESYKVHSKICLITKKDSTGVKYYTQIGTGNYNEKTTTQYTDLSIIIFNQEIGDDADNFFKNIIIGNLEGSYKHLLVAPNSLKSKIIELINFESQKGEEGYIFLKMNSLTDRDIINVIQKASKNGVKVEMVIRGICCLLPDAKDLTDNIYIKNIIGRFLEHTRIYVFGKDTDKKIYISSADFMTRNTERRVEVACPIYAENTRYKIEKIIELNKNDNVKSCRLDSNGKYIKIDDNSAPVDSQSIMLSENLSYHFEPYIIEDKKSSTPITFIKNIFKNFVKWDIIFT